ncbi:MAG: hypothetical protein GW748_01840 [Alphaproteobacteria bacterium]|nr:hypothetical protein [Alphaproteobacteria bacterium]NCQ66472.1 hypothetical protein [Alphaproteobacteria bacterium]
MCVILRYDGIMSHGYPIELIKAARCRALFQQPYSPDLNKIDLQNRDNAGQYKELFFYTEKHSKDR